MNFYIVAIQGVPKLLQDIAEPIAKFNFDHYAQAFQVYYEKHVATFEALENGYNPAIDKEQYIENMAYALVNEAVSQMQEAPKKSAKEKMLVDYNLCLVAYTYPAILQYGKNSSRPFADKIQQLWKKQFPKTNIQVSDYETISRGFKRNFCYITTAVCDTFGKPDNCYELTLLRQYRDSYLMMQDGGEELVHEYYNLAPTIVKHINKQDQKREIYEGIWSDYLKPCISMIENGENEACKELYIRMVRDMQKEYFIQ